MSYQHALKLVHADALYCAVQRQAHKAECEAQWFTAAKLRLWLAKRATAILARARGQAKGVL